MLMAAGIRQQRIRLSTVVKSPRAEWIGGEFSSLHAGEEQTGSCKDSFDEFFTARRSLCHNWSHLQDTCRGLRWFRPWPDPLPRCLSSSVDAEEKHDNNAAERISVVTLVSRPGPF